MCKLLSRDLKLYSLFAAAAIFSAGPAAAQDLGSDPPNASSNRGQTATGSYSLDRMESVNAINGNMSLTIPAGRLPPGPGGFYASVNLVYNSTIFDIQTMIPSDDTERLAGVVCSEHAWGRLKYGYKYALWSQTRLSVFNSTNNATCSNVTSTEAANWYKTVLATPDGANRVLRLVGALDINGNATSISLSTDTNQSYDIYDFAGYTNLNCGLSAPQFLGTLIFATADSTYIRVEANTVANRWTAYFPDGTQVAGTIIAPGGHAVDSDASQVTDRNGNTLTITGNCTIGSVCTETLTDAQSRAVTISYSSNSGGTWADSITWPGPNGP